MKLQSQLDEMGIRYQLREHPTAYTAADLAAKEHIQSAAAQRRPRRFREEPEEGTPSSDGIGS